MGTRDVRRKVGSTSVGSVPVRVPFSGTEWRRGGVGEAPRPLAAPVVDVRRVTRWNISNGMNAMDTAIRERAL